MLFARDEARVGTLLAALRLARKTPQPRLRCNRIVPCLAGLSRSCGVGDFCSPSLRAWFTVWLMNLFDLSGEVAVVIGATGALGGAMAHALGKAGSAVAVVGAQC